MKQVINFSHEKLIVATSSTATPRQLATEASVAPADVYQAAGAVDARVVMRSSSSIDIHLALSRISFKVAE